MTTQIQKSWIETAAQNHCHVVTQVWSVIQTFLTKIQRVDLLSGVGFGTEVQELGRRKWHFCEFPSTERAIYKAAGYTYPRYQQFRVLGFPLIQQQQSKAAGAAMVLKTELCRFSGAKIYPGRGIRFIRSDSQVFLFINSKCKRYFHNRLKPSKITWTAMFRKQHKKDIAQESVKKRRRTNKKPYSRSIVGATLEVIQKRRTEKPEVRDAAREAALREIKERIKKTKDEKKAKKAEVVAKQKVKGQNISKGAAPKGPKLGGGGGKR
ncbi:PREDICTED: 60S ribosomal protein L24-like [Fragaria vesca subsp. vesca]